MDYMNIQSKLFRFVIRVVKWLLILLGIVKIIELVAAAWFFSIGPFSSPMVEPDGLRSHRIALTSLSPVGDAYYFELADKNATVRIGKMELATKEGTLFIPDHPDDELGAPSASVDNKSLAIVIRSKKSNFEISQVGVVDLNNLKYRAITTSQTYKQFPSFSRDGKKLIYAQASRIRATGKTRFSQWDIYEVDVDSGVERRLTNFCFFSVGSPYYLSNQQKFVFSGERPSCNVAESDLLAGRDSRKENHVVSSIYLRKTDSNSPLTPLFDDSNENFAPVVTAGDNIFFIAKTQNSKASSGGYYNYDFFVYQNGEVRRLTDLHTYITGYAASQDGSKLIFGNDKDRNRNVVFELFDVARNVFKSIDIGNPASYHSVNLKKED